MFRSRRIFTRKAILPALIAEVFPRRMAWADGARNVYGESLVDEKFAQCRSTACVPVRVITGGFSDDIPQLASARRRDAAHNVRDFVG